VKLIALVLGAVLLAGCGTEFVDEPPREPRTAEEVPGSTEAADPTRIVIPSIEAVSTLIPLTLDENDTLVPPPVDEPMQAGWYAGRDPEFSGDEYKPGQVGPAVIAGHVDGIGLDGRKGAPGIFKKLQDVHVGDEIVIERDDAPTLVFEAYAIEKHRKDQFPTDRVYGMTTEPELRLITCGGAFDSGSGHYVDNWIVWAKLKP
jgi:sortase (surface protein transpeptidase)